MYHRKAAQAARGRAPGSSAPPLLSYATGCWWPSSGWVKIAATAMLLASVVRTARRAGSKVRNTGAEERVQLQSVEARLGFVRPRESRCRAAWPLPSAVSGAATSA